MNVAVFVAHSAAAKGACHFDVVRFSGNPHKPVRQVQAIIARGEIARYLWLVRNRMNAGLMIRIRSEIDYRAAVI